MTAKEYLSKLYELKAMCEKDPALWDVYADVRIKYQIEKMKGVIYDEDHGNVGRDFLETELKNEGFIFFPDGETIFS